MLNSGEAHVNVESSVARVKARTVEVLNALPNLRSQEKLGEHAIEIKPKKTVNRFGLGAYDEKGEVTSEKEHGEQMVAGAAALIQEELGGSQKLFGEDPQLHDVFATNEASYGPYLRARESFRKALDRRDHNIALGALVGVHSTGKSMSRYGANSGHPDDLTRKGLPVQVGEALFVALGNRVARTVTNEAQQEAQRIDDDYVAGQRPILEGEITRLKDEQIPGQESTIREKEALKTEASVKNTHAKEEVKRVEKEKGEVHTQVMESVAKISPEKEDELRKVVERNIAVLTEKGFLKKNIVIDESGFTHIDRAIGDVIEATPELQILLHRFGFQKPTDVIMAHVEKSVALYSPSSPLTFFDDAQSLLADVGFHHLRGSFQQQRVYAQKMIDNPKTKDIGQKYLRDMAKRALGIFYILKGDKFTPYGQNSPRLADSSLHRVISYGLSNTDLNKTTKQTAEEAEAALKRADQEHSSQEGTLRSLQRRLPEKEEELKRLEYGRNSRVDKTTFEIMAQLLQTASGPAITFDNIAANRFSSPQYFESKLYQDAASALAKGLPHFVANNPRFPRAAEEAVRSGNIQRASVERVAQLPDFLPPLVDALLPENHPTKAAASQFITDVLRRFPQNPHIRSYTGGELKAIDEQEVLRRYGGMMEVVRAAAAGGWVGTIPKEAPRPALSQVRELNMKGEQGKVVALYGQAAEGVKRFLASQKLDHYYLVSNYMMVHPLSDLSKLAPFPYVDEKQFANNSYRALDHLLYFSEPELQGVYAVENPLSR